MKLVDGLIKEYAARGFTISREEAGEIAMEQPERVIVTRHPAAVAFIRRERPDFCEAPVMESATPADVRRRWVAGNVPLHLAALADMVIAVEFTGPPPRGGEYSLADMDAAGARLREYRVASVKPQTAESVRGDAELALGFFAGRKEK